MTANPIDLRCAALDAQISSRVAIDRWLKEKKVTGDARILAHKLIEHAGKRLPNALTLDQIELVCTTLEGI